MQITEYDKETNEQGNTMILVTIDTMPDTWVVLCSLDQFCDWLEETFDLNDYKEHGVVDHGEGEYSNALFIHFESVLSDYLNIEYLQAYLIQNPIEMNQYFKHKSTNCYYAVIDGKYYLVHLFLFLKSISVEVKEERLFADNYINEYYEKCTREEFESAKSEALSKL